MSSVNGYTTMSWCLTRVLQATQGRACFQAPYYVECGAVHRLLRHPGRLSLSVRWLTHVSTFITTIVKINELSHSREEKHGSKC